MIENGVNPEALAVRTLALHEDRPADIRQTVIKELRKEATSAEMDMKARRRGA